MTKDQVDKILKSIDYYTSFKKMMNHAYPNINYGKRLGELSFDSIFDADKQYVFNGDTSKEQFENWTKILNTKKSTEEELLVVCLKIFDWGNVLKGNVTSALDLYEQKKLKKYIHSISKLLTSEKSIKKSDISQEEILWSSGWTKVYSFMNPEILIYDSRVSAFLNYTLINCYENLSDVQKNNFHQLTSHLFNFSGAINRERKVSKTYGFKNQHPKGIKGFNANLVSSWITQLTKEELKIDESIRAFERAFFMLGFDLKQLKNNS